MNIREHDSYKTLVRAYGILTIAAQTRGFMKAYRDDILIQFIENNFAEDLDRLGLSPCPFEQGIPRIEFEEFAKLNGDFERALSMQSEYSRMREWNVPSSELKTFRTVQQNLVKHAILDTHKLLKLLGSRH